MVLLAAALNAWLGRAGLMAGVAVAGFADAHAPAISVATLVAGGTLAPADAVPAVLLAMSANTVSKIVLAAVNGGRRFAWRLARGLLLALAAAWAGGLLL